MKSIETPQSRCHLGVARADITPSIGIYSRTWGAALHDCATAVHRPLFATALWFRAFSTEQQEAQLILALDHGTLDSDEMNRLRRAVCHAVPLKPHQVHLCLSHTHGSGNPSRARIDLPGGELIVPNLEALAEKCAILAATAAKKAKPGTIVYGTGRCSLAANRDYWDADHRGYVCGYNPLGPTDDTVLVARLTDDDGIMLGTLVNYACHPTTLAWENTAISPDFVGAMREVIERETHAPCIFLQGASGDLGPREGFVGDWKVADRNGRQLGFSALAAIESLPPSGTRFAYDGHVVSGTDLGTWSHEPLDYSTLDDQAHWTSRHFTVPLTYRCDLPSLEQTEQQLADCRAKEREAAKHNHSEQLREARAHTEQMTRQRDRLAALPAGEAYPFPVNVLRIGLGLWVLVPGELYHTFQTALRTRFPNTAIVVSTLTGDWQPGYLPTACSYGQGIYQELTASLASGSLEILIDSVAQAIQQLLTSPLPSDAIKRTALTRSA